MCVDSPQHRAQPHQSFSSPGQDKGYLSPVILAETSVLSHLGHKECMNWSACSKSVLSPHHSNEQNCQGVAPSELRGQGFPTVQSNGGHATKQVEVGPQDPA